MLVVTIDTLAPELKYNHAGAEDGHQQLQHLQYYILHNPSMDQPNKTQRLLFNLHLNLLSTDSTVTDVVYLVTMCQPVD